jgi:hypothetical protein
VIVFNKLVNDLEKNITIKMAKQIAIIDFLKSSIFYEKGRLINIQEINRITYQTLIRRNELVECTCYETESELY